MNWKKAFLTVSLVSIGALMGLIISAEGPFHQTSVAPAGLLANPPRPPAAVTPELRSSLVTARQLSQAFAWASQQAVQAVVMIESEQDVEMRSAPQSLFDLFPQFRMPHQGEGNEPQRRTRRGLGSGVIVRADGYILTNNHVIQDADRLRVVLGDDDEPISAEVVGSDPFTDIAVVRIDRQNLPVLPFGNSDSLMVGEWVIAVGSPFENNLQHTVTAGIVSALGRNINLVGPRSGYTGFEDFIQTDAAINPGNSGGALINLNGQLIGINTAISSNTGSNAGIGFAIPSNMAQDIMGRLIEHGEIRRGYLGVEVQAVTREIQESMSLPDRNCVLIGAVVEGGPADQAGIQEGDVITAVNGQAAEGLNDFRFRVSSNEPGQTVRLTVLRGGNRSEVQVTLGELPKEFQPRGAHRRRRNEAQQESTEAEIPRLGMTVSTLTEDMRDQHSIPESVTGVVITELEAGGQARARGLLVGDIIQEANRQSVEGARAFAQLVEGTEPGRPLLLFVRRGESTLFVGVRVPEE